IVKKHAEDAEKLIRQTDDYKERAKKAASEIGKAFLAIGSMAAAGTTAAITAAAKNETAFAKVRTLLSSDTNAEGYADAIKAAVRETGVSFGGLSESVYSAISASVDEKSAVGFTAEAVKLAKGGFTDAATSVDVLTTAINAYGLAAEDASHISDVLVTAQNEGKTTVNELASSLGTTIPIANGAGAAIEDLAAQYAVMTKNGVATAEAGTGIKAMLSELNNAGSNISKTLRELTGKSFSELQAEGNNTADILNILGRYAAENGKKLSDLFGSVEAGAAAFTLVKDGGEDFNRILAKMETEAGAAEKAYETMANTTEERFEKLKNRFLLSVSEIGEKILPYVEEFFDYIDEHSDELEDGIEEAGKLLLDFSKALGEVVKIGWEFRDVLLMAGAAVGGWKLGQAVSDVLKFGKALTSAGAAGGGFTTALQSVGAKSALVTAVIAALVAEFNWLKQGFTVSDDVRELAESVDRLKGSVESAVSGFEAEAAVLRTKAQAYEELRVKTDRTASEEERLAALAEELQGTLGGNCTVVNALTGEYNDLTQAVDEYIKKQSASIRMSALEEQAKEAYKTIDEIEKKIEERSEEHQKFINDQKEQWAFFAERGVDISELTINVETSNYLNEMAALREAKAEAERIVADYENEFSEYMRGISEDHEASAGSVDRLTDSLDKEILSVEELAKAIEAERTAADELSAANDKLLSDYEELYALLGKVRSGEALTYEEIQKLIAVYPELMKHITLTADGYAVEKSAVDALNAALDDSVGTQIDAEREKTLAAIEGARERIKIYQREAEALAKTIAMTGGGTDEERERYKLYSSAIAEESDYLDGLYAQLNKSDALNVGEYLKNTATGGSSSTSGTSSGSTPSQKEETETTEEERRKAEYDRKLKNLNYQRDMDMIDEDEYYEWFGKLRDEYLAEGSDEWRSANVDIHRYEKSKAEAAEKEAESAAGNAAKGTVISIDSYIPTIWDDEEERERKLQEALGIELAGNSKTASISSVELTDPLGAATALSPSTSAVSSAQSAAEATLSDVVKELRELKEADVKRTISLDVDLYARDLAIGRVSIPDINEIAKQTGKNPFEFM
ncbi:MAG: phage tail tape measure protein, partial [Bacteroides sp.]|nr:phage tail tape measure protein [Eubacterium sp.]MCM1419662.1 phage tail tape measure protein [Roseburia sp.]MCM1463711.1 phage tail tape measure protein [Bacteroides sp.]